MSLIKNFVSLSNKAHLSSIGYNLVYVVYRKNRNLFSFLLFSHLLFISSLSEHNINLLFIAYSKELLVKTQKLLN